MTPAASPSSPQGIRCMMMRGGTSRGLYFMATDLPTDPAERDQLLLRVMGSGDPLQTDGVGGGHPLTSKVAVASSSAQDDADVDYLFLQLGVPGTAAPISLRFADTEGSVTGSLLPTGSVIDGIEVTCVDNGMPVVVARAADLGISGHETVDELGSDAGLAARLPGGTGAELGRFGAGSVIVDIEHPTGHLEVEVELDTSVQPPRVLSSGVIRTARKLFDGTVFAASAPSTTGTES